MFNIKLNQREIKGLDGKLIIESAKENAIFIEHSCLSGRCSSCKAKLISGTTQTVKPELGLSLKEKEEGYILTCINKPNSDIELEIEILENFEFIPIRVIPAKISSISKITPDIIKLVLRFPPNTLFNFLAGQYVNIIKGDIRRSYSIAGQIDGNNLIFYIKKFEEGRMSEYLFYEARENDLLRVEGPFGSFFLREYSLKNLIFLATGTGIAPILSILHKAFENNVFDKKNVYLFHGVRFKEELIEQEFFNNCGINYFPTLSKSHIPDYHFGYVQNIAIQQRIDLKASTVYACGSHEMIEDAREVFYKNGLSYKEFYSDAFLESN